MTILDTPGLKDTRQTAQEVQRELRRSISLLYPGPHGFLIVIRIGRFTEEEKEAVWHIKQAMGSHALAFSVVVFTHGDMLEEGATVQQYLMEECHDLAELVAACGGRYCVFNNQSTRSKEQVLEMIALVDTVMQGNEWNYYSCKMLQRVENDTELQFLKDEMLKRSQETEIKEWFERELEIMEDRSRKELAALRIKQSVDKEKAEIVARELEEAFRQEINEIKMRNEERQIHDMLQLMEVQRQEEERRDALQGKLHNVTKILESQVQREETLRRAMEEMVQRDKVESEKNDREKAALQKEVDKLSLRLMEQSRRDEDRRQKMEAIMRRQREENELQQQVLMEKQKAERKRVEALQQELKVIKIKKEQQRSKEENPKQVEKLKTHMAKPVLKKASAKTHSSMSTVTGYIQEMGLMGVNATLESIGAPCCIQ